jgi:SAM-dependent methyltransferase
VDSTEVRRSWAERSGEYSPAYYAYYGPDERSEAVREILDRRLDRDACVLELGCSSGRHLAHLRDHGFENLSGIDVNEDSFDVMAEHYPRLAESGTFHAGAIEEFLPELDDDAFDVVYSVETLQHVHPEDTWVFEEVLRVCSDLLVTVENEGNGARRGREGAEVSYVNDEFPLYHRNWRDVFSALGAVQVVKEPSERDTLRAFRVV